MTYILRSQNMCYTFMRGHPMQKSFIRYSTSTAELNKFEIDEKILLAEENRRRCMDKMRQSPPVGIKLKGGKSEHKFAAVLIALCTEENTSNISLLYTRRSHLLSRHMRQISFPGGIKDDDEEFVKCALRETHEEIGLPPHRVNIWGSGNLINPPYTAAIMPVIGVIKNFKESELKLNSAEVEEAFTIPIKHLANPQTLCYTQFKSGYSSPVFVIDNKRIWGITGFITHIFMNCFLPPEMNKLQGRVKFLKGYRIKSQ